MSGDVPAPISRSSLAKVPGTLGRIALERHEDSLNGEFSPVQASGASFAEALRSDGLRIIAEIKRSSPSQGSIAPLEPAETAVSYATAGASCLSVLTEPRHFGGELAHLEQVRAATGLPLLRKDFTVHPQQMAEAAAAGASAVLLIVAILGDSTAAYLQLARSLGLDALVEVHSRPELDIALAADADIIGINNRDLRSLEIDLATAPTLGREARERGYGGILVAESGYRTADELRSVRDFADAALIGTSLAGSGDPGAALARLIGDLNAA